MEMKQHINPPTGRRWSPGELDLHASSSGKKPGIKYYKKISPATPPTTNKTNKQTTRRTTTKSNKALIFNPPTGRWSPGEMALRAVRAVVLV